MSHEKRFQEMSFFDHLEELRWAILKSVIAVLLGMVVCFLFASEIIDFLIIPTKSHDVLELQFIRPSGMFMLMIYISLGCGLVVALPVLLYQAWQFVAPGLLDNEKKYVPYVVVFSTILFLLGSSFSYYILIPILINFMLFIGSGVAEVKAQWDISMYMSMVIKMILIMGAVFQMPIVVAFLTWIRLLSPKLLKDSWRYAMVIIFVLAAVITPTGDPLTQIIVAIPLIILYIVSVFVSWFIARGREEEEPSEEEDQDAIDAVAPQSPDSPTISRSVPDYTNPRTGYMGESEWEDDDEFVFEYGDEMANMPPYLPVDEKDDETVEDKGSKTDRLSDSDSDDSDSEETDESPTTDATGSEDIETNTGQAEEDTTEESNRNGEEDTPTDESSEKDGASEESPDKPDTDDSPPTKGDKNPSG